MQQSDADQAYIQASLKGTPTWVALPPDQWPKAWSGMRRPVCRLLKALYGRPDSGTYWEEHCDAHVLKAGVRQSCEMRGMLDITLPSLSSS